MPTPSCRTTDTALAPQNEQVLSGPISLFNLCSLVEPACSSRGKGCDGNHFRFQWASLSDVEMRPYGASGPGKSSEQGLHLCFPEVPLSCCHPLPPLSHRWGVLFTKRTHLGCQPEEALSWMLVAALVDH